jgi:hypothetical protein
MCQGYFVCKLDGEKRRPSNKHFGHSFEISLVLIRFNEKCSDIIAWISLRKLRTPGPLLVRWEFSTWLRNGLKLMRRFNTYRRMHLKVDVFDAMVRYTLLLMIKQ